MCEDDTTEDTTEVNPDTPDDGDPVRIETPVETRGKPRPALDYHRPRSLDRWRPGRFLRG
jgi:hypothetical protein